MPKIVTEGTHLLQNIKVIEGVLWRQKMSHGVEKNRNRDPLVSSGFAMHGKMLVLRTAGFPEKRLTCTKKWCMQGAYSVV